MASSSSHQPVLITVAQRGAQGDCQKFNVGNANGGNRNGNGNAGNRKAGTDRDVEQQCRSYYKHRTLESKQEHPHLYIVSFVNGGLGVLVLSYILWANSSSRGEDIVGRYILGNGVVGFELNGCGRFRKWIVQAVK
jgi:hypothetical protein